MLKMDVNLNTILDFSIGESHMMILGDIVRTAEECKERPSILRCYEREVKRELREQKECSNIAKVEEDKENQPKKQGKSLFSSKMDTLIS